MRKPGLLILFLVLIFEAVLAQPQRRKGSVSGKITKPFAGVSVVLKGVHFDPQRSFDSYRTMAGPDGSFHIADVDPGSYRLKADGPGITEESEIPVTVKTRQHLKHVVLTLVPKRTLCGRVTDKDGHPLTSNLSAYPAGEFWPLTFESRATTTSDRDGKFRFPDLKPGPYFLYGFSGGFEGWFPLSRTISGAQPIEIGKAESSDCDIDFLMPSSSDWVHKIRGTFEGIQTNTSEGPFSVVMLEKNPAGPMRIHTGNIDVKDIRSNGSFEFLYGEAGYYRIVLAANPGFLGSTEPGIHFFADAEVAMENKDIDNVKLRSIPQTSLSGELKLDGLSRRMACPNGEYQFVKIENVDDGEHGKVQIDEKGEFHFSQVSAGKYRIRIGPLDEKATYVESISLDGRPIKSDELILAPDKPSRVIVTLTGYSSSDRALPNAEAIGDRRRIDVGSVSGKVENVTNGPITVQLWALRFNSADSYEYFTTPGADGSFEFRNVDPGIYVVVVKGRDYVPVEYGSSGAQRQGAPITVMPGKRVEGLRIRAVPQHLICGRVTDQNGAPLADVPVGLLRLQPRWKTAYYVSGEEVRTDKDGNYRFEGQNPDPGKYFVVTVTSNHRYWYPSSDSFGEARSVDVHDDAAGCAANVKVPPVRNGFHVRGKVAGSVPSELGDKFLVLLNEPNVEGVAEVSKSALVAAGEPFDLSDVSPGNYELVVQPAHDPKLCEAKDLSPTRKGICQALYFTGPKPTPIILARKAISITDGDVESSVEQLPLTSLTGEVILEGNAKVPSNQFVRLIGTQGNTRDQEQWARFDLDGTFAFQHLVAGWYRLENEGPYLRPGAYVKAVLLNGRPMETPEFELTSASANKLTWVIASDAGEIKVKVTSASPSIDLGGSTACRPRVFVSQKFVLIPDSLAPDLSNLIVSRFGSTDGTVEETNIAPGHYRVVASDTLDWTWGLQGRPEWTDKKFIEAIAQLGQPIEVKPSEHLTLTLPSKSWEIQDIMAKFGEPLTLEDHGMSPFGNRWFEPVDMSQASPRSE